MKYKYTRKEIADKWETTIKYSGNDLIKDLLAQKEDRKEHAYFTSPIFHEKTITTPSPLEIEEIEEYIFETSYDRKIFNKLIRNQKKLYQLIKEKL